MNRILVQKLKFDCKTFTDKKKKNRILSFKITVSNCYNPFYYLNDNNDSSIFNTNRFREIFQEYYKFKEFYDIILRYNKIYLAQKTNI